MACQPRCMIYDLIVVKKRDENGAQIHRNGPLVIVLHQHLVDAQVLVEPLVIILIKRFDY